MADRSQAPDAVVGLALAMQSAPGRFALLVGSGISYASGIPTGWAVVSDLARGAAVAGGEPEPPSDPVAWYAAQFGGSPNYSGLLEAVAPTPAQRRDLLAAYFEPTDEELESGLKSPTGAHAAIARLVARGTVSVIVTTNFDRLLEKAIQAEGIEPLVVATAAAAHGTTPLAHSRCTIIKVHGDYLDPSIKNTVGELDAYEPSLDTLLDRAFDDYGLVICGWSGTWDPALRNAIERCSTRRYGTYWATHGDLTPEGERLVTNRAAAVITIDGADEFFQGLLSKVEALDDLRRRSTTGVEVVTAEAKRYLPDPVHRIRLHDLAMDAAERAIATIDFDGNRSSSYSDLLDKARDIEHAAAEMVGVVAVIAQFADRLDQRELLQRLLVRLASPTDVRLGGYTAWINLRGYPALLAMYGAGLTATANDNWPTLSSVLSTRVNDPSRNSADNPVPFPSMFAPWSVLDHGAINAAFSPPGRKTPVSDYLYDHFAEMLPPQLRLSEDQFAQCFDEWEYLLGVVTHDVAGRGPIGRFVWKHRYAFEDMSPDRAVLGATENLLNSGFFASTAEHLAEVRSDYDEMVRRSGLRI